MEGIIVPRKKTNSKKIEVFISENIYEKLVKKSTESGNTVSGFARSLIMQHFSSVDDKQ